MRFTQKLIACAALSAATLCANATQMSGGPLNFTFSGSTTDTWTFTLGSGFTYDVVLNASSTSGGYFSASGLAGGSLPSNTQFFFSSALYDDGTTRTVHLDPGTYSWTIQTSSAYAGTLTAVATANAVPEPGAAALVLMALGAMGCMTTRGKGQKVG